MAAKFAYKLSLLMLTSMLAGVTNKQVSALRDPLATTDIGINSDSNGAARLLPPNHTPMFQSSVSPLVVSTVNNRQSVPTPSLRLPLINQQSTIMSNNNNEGQRSQSTQAMIATRPTTNEPQSSATNINTNHINDVSPTQFNPQNNSPINGASRIRQQGPVVTMTTRFPFHEANVQSLTPQTQSYGQPQLRPNTSPQQMQQIHSIRPQHMTPAPTVPTATPSTPIASTNTRPTTIYSDDQDSEFLSGHVAGGNSNNQRVANYITGPMGTVPMLNSIHSTDSAIMSTIMADGADAVATATNSVAHQEICYTPLALFLVILVTVLVTLVVSLGLYLALRHSNRNRFDLIEHSKKHTIHRHPTNLHLGSGYGDDQYGAFDNPFFHMDGGDVELATSARQATSRQAHTLYRPETNNQQQVTGEMDQLIAVDLTGHDFIGLGFDVEGSMKDGIYVRQVMSRGPAFESQCIEPGDRIRGLTIAFDHVDLKDAIELLTCGAPYQMRLLLEKCGRRRAANKQKITTGATAKTALRKLGDLCPSRMSSGASAASILHHNQSMYHHDNHRVERGQISSFDSLASTMNGSTSGNHQHRRRRRSMEDNTSHLDRIGLETQLPSDRGIGTGAAKIKTTDKENKTSIDIEWQARSQPELTQVVSDPRHAKNKAKHQHIMHHRESSVSVPEFPITPSCLHETLTRDSRLASSAKIPDESLTNRSEQSAACEFSDDDDDQGEQDPTHVFVIDPKDVIGVTRKDHNQDPYPQTEPNAEIKRS